VRSLDSAAAVLAAATTLPALSALAADIGFTPPALPLHAELRGALGLQDLSIHDAAVLSGPGALRALVVQSGAGAPLRDTVSTIARRLTSRAPQLLWLLIAAQHDTPELAIATWTENGHGARVAALLLDRTRVLPSDAETFNALAGSASEPDLLAHSCWLDILGREAITRRFYRALERVMGELARRSTGRAGDAARGELALLNVSRLLFLSFLESRGWLNGDPRFLSTTFAHCMEHGGRFHARALQPLFFGTLNTPMRSRARAARAFGRIPFLNGGLFARTPLERRHRHVTFPDDALGLVFSDLLTRYRFTAREDGAGWSEAAIDPEMLGKAFESLMGAQERRASGAFYTPQPLVAHVTRTALVHALARLGPHAAIVEAALRGERSTGDGCALLHEHIGALRVLDPACGSGAFLVHALETLAALRVATGDARRLAVIRRELLTRSIFGVDVNPMAVWLCELRLWLSVIIESDEADPLAITPLPNLDRNVRVGDSLAGDAFTGVALARSGASIERLRARYARATGTRKHAVRRQLDRAERSMALAHLDHQRECTTARRRDLLSALRSLDLFGRRPPPTAAERDQLAADRTHARSLAAARRALENGGALPFAWVTHFPDVAERGGFDVVIGNPPWVRLHRIPSHTRAALRWRYASFRLAAWHRGATIAGAGPGFAAQVDLAALFAERSLELLRNGGTLALLLPMKMWSALAGGGIRRVMTDRAHLVAIEDFTESPPAFQAAVYPSLLVAARTVAPASSTSPVSPDPAGEKKPHIAATLHRSRSALRWEIAANRLALDDDAASPWLLLPAAVRDAFDEIARVGTPLAESAFGAPRLGVKSGCNEAFLVEWEGRGDTALATVRSGGRSGCVERSLLRPVLRGEGIARWSAAERASWLLWTHGADGAPLRALPPGAAAWLAPWRSTLAARSDGHGRTPWWSLFRTASASSSCARVVWADVSREPRALVLAPGDCTVPLNSCYVLPCRDPRDAAALAALLNSPLAAAWLNALAEPARGGYRRYLAWTVALLPIPRDWSRARDILAPVAERALAGDEPANDRLTCAALQAYRLPLAHAEPLLTWCTR